MPQLWSEGTGEAYVKRKASEMLEFLEDRRMMEDDRWATMQELGKNLLMTEYTTYGILVYLWLQDKVAIKEGLNGELSVSIIWDGDYPDSPKAESSSHSEQ